MATAEEIAVFASETDAEQAYFGQAGSGNVGGDGNLNTGEGWDQPTTLEELAGGWSLLRQNQAVTAGGNTRYFVAGGPGEFSFLDASGAAQTPPTDATLSEVPSFDSEAAAREAHAAWIEANPEFSGGGQGDGENLSWSEFAVLEEAAPWFIMSSERSDGQATEFLIAGQDADKTTIYLGPNVEIITDGTPHIYTERAAVDAALDEYFQAAESGEVPPDQQPTGISPSPEDVNQDSPAPGGSGGIIDTIIGTALSNPMLVLGALVVAYLLYRRYQAQAQAGGPSGSGSGPDPAEIGPGGGPEI